MVKGACMAKGGGVHGKGWGVHGKRGACMVGSMHGGGHVWQGVVHGRVGMHGREHACQERWPLQWTVRILMECILVRTSIMYNCPD